MSISRRSFIKSTAKIAAGTGLMLSGTAPVYSAPKTKSALTKIDEKDKVLVFIMLDGGNDSYNMLVPNSEKHYKEYQRTRSNLALEINQLLPLNNTRDQQGRTFGLHESMPEVRDLFDQKRLAFVANIGPMVEPVSKAQFHNDQSQLPLGLMSHSDQFKHWQTARPGERINHGWFGSFADALQANKHMSDIPMNISLAGHNIMQNGFLSSPYSITEEGSVGLIINDAKRDLDKVLLESFEKSLNMEYRNDPFKASYLSITRESQAQHENFAKAVDPITIKTSFSDSPLSKQLKKVAQSIKASEKLGHKKQTYFIRYIGWDHHDELLNKQANMLSVLSKALGEFQNSLDKLGVSDKVVTFTGSDFGRTLTSNGNGTDHGWGGNTLIMGNSVNGGQVFGHYPSLALGEDNALDIGDGVLLPTTSIDELYAQLALWFGVHESELTTLFPNLKNFRQKDQPHKLSDILKIS